MLGLPVQGRNEKAFGAQFAHGMRGVAQHHLRVHGLRQEGAHLPAVLGLMRPENAEGIAVMAAENGVDVLGGHAQLLWQGVC